MHWNLLVLFASSLVLLLGVASPAAGGGPWRAQVVDAETKQPLEGVVVLAVWYKATRTFGGPSEEYHNSEEVLTDKDGRFTIAARSFFSLNPLVFFRGPHFLIFKPGYGRALWPGGKQREIWPEENLARIVIDLPQLKTLEARRSHLGGLRSGFSTVPLERTPLLQRAIVEERKALGYTTGTEVR